MMVKKLNFNILFLSGFWILLFSLSAFKYSGSFFTFTVFSLISLILLISGFYQKITYGYLFLTVFLWLGFWLKLVMSLIFEKPLTEAFGQFNSSPASWDEVLWIVNAAFLAVLCSRIIIFRFFKINTIFFQTQTSPPAFYVQYRKPLGVLALLSIIILAGLNTVYGVHQVGLLPRTIFPWPLNALISFALNIGLAMMISCLLYWEVLLNGKSKFYTFLSIFEGFVVSASMLSRSIFIFRLLPLMLVSLYNQLWEKLRKNVPLIIALGLFLVLSISITTIFRAYLFPTQDMLKEKDQRITRLEVIEGGLERVKILIEKGEPQQQHLHELQKEQQRLQEEIRVAHQKNSSNFFKKMQSSFMSDLKKELQYKALVRIYNLLAGRFVGLEGVMTLQAYEQKSFTTFSQALTEKRSADTVTFYQKISNSNYQDADTNVWQFASLPGAIAFFYYSGSILIVILGMMFFTFLIIFFESFIFKFTGNSFLCGLLGLSVAHLIAQFGITPRQELPYLSMIIITLLFTIFISKKNHLEQKIK